MIQTATQTWFLRPAPTVCTVASVLISEVEPDVRRLLAVMVERLGHEAIVLASDVVAPPRADLLLLEPLSRQGVEHVRLVRSFFPDLPVVCLNPLPAEAVVLGRGPISFLPKPFTLEQLAAAVDESASPV